MEVNFMSQVVEAIHLMYEDYPALEKQCMFCLLNGLKNTKDKIPLYEWFEEHNICSICGADLVTITNEEVHTELDGNPVEKLTEKVCPYCDIGV